MMLYLFFFLYIIILNRILIYGVRYTIVTLYRIKERLNIFFNNFFFNGKKNLFLSNDSLRVTATYAYKLNCICDVSLPKYTITWKHNGWPIVILCKLNYVLIKGDKLDKFL